MEIAIIGSGRVGTALGVLWAAADHTVVAASGSERTRERVHRFLPTTSFHPSQEAASLGEVVVIGVPDDAIEPTCREIASALRSGQTLMHLSGSVGLDA